MPSHQPIARPLTMHELQGTQPKGLGRIMFSVAEALPARSSAAAAAIMRARMVPVAASARMCVAGNDR